MRWNTLPPRSEQPWVKCFAWLPVEVDDGEWVWLESIERRLVFPFLHTARGVFFQHRLIESAQGAQEGKP